MNHDEIWDDSALIESWNDALAEYKKYHSIHAKGGSVDDLPPKRSETRPDAKPETRGSSQPMDESEVEERDETAMRDAQMDGGFRGETSQDDSTGPGATVGLAEPGALGPQTLLGGVQDEGLKKLLMSWYYAGYYTGLYEGQQQQQAKQQGQGKQHAQAQGDASA
ncbi:hypothetical protein NKR19_g564 [Coniochaeta hoffmannii]|uniref:Survival Motor Neuron Gemin2-binding domain-containing protein n=1 Tax=Coniochaeta hoffmannii TaxID=91930 RepID=A0AA38W0R9_9PEZI|nr:hypothetical protein NKR19_g564 [Coniochaeta hoffmannii]